ncbi:hypothetical protein [Streptomyces sp. STCH 565 A]|uniref:hypothetical protein n=1 Tax=Streptomyces sp. STCH 565 A TaxID=2950532 RepID=UPI002075F9F0|nr:hypothetical protein [Streptomyces sp. STCH 565 A]MCM8555674.1 hypothetical protein [Streptomyces sp. STCH 565 A]
MSSTMEWIRRTYDVPARHGMRIEYDGKPATIVGAGGGYLRFRVDGEKHRTVGHPCYRIVYPAVPEPARPRGWCKHCGKDRAMTRDGAMGNHRWGGKGWSDPCPGAGKPPWKPVRNLTHPGEQRAKAAS